MNTLPHNLLMGEKKKIEPAAEEIEIDHVKHLHWMANEVTKDMITIVEQKAEVTLSAIVTGAHLPDVTDAQIRLQAAKLACLQETLATLKNAN